MEILIIKTWCNPHRGILIKVCYWDSVVIACVFGTMLKNSAGPCANQALFVWAGCGCSCH